MYKSNKEINDKNQIFISLFFSALALWVALANYFDMLPGDYLTIALCNKVLPVVVIALLISITSFFLNDLFKFLQFIIITLVAVLALYYNDIGDTEFAIFMGFGIVSGLCYGFIGEKKSFLKPNKYFYIYLSFYVFVFVLKCLTENKQILFKIDALIVTGACLYIMYRFISPRFIMIQNQVEKKEAEIIEKNNNIKKIQPFADTGEVFADTMHSLKNIICGIKMNMQISETDIETMENIKKGIDKINDLSTYVTKYIKYKKNDDFKIESVKNIIETAIYILDAKNYYNTEINTISDCLADINPQETLNTFTNILKNSMENINNQNKRSIIIDLYKIRSELTVKISDNGSGIKDCFNCSKNCNNCTNFEIGKSDKFNGTGFGMVQIKKYCNKYNYNLKIKSSKIGTKTIITMR